MTRNQKLTLALTLLSLLVGLGGVGLWFALRKLVHSYPETTVLLLILLLLWFLGSLLYFSSHPVVRLDPEIPKEISDGHE